MKFASNQIKSKLGKKVFASPKPGGPKMMKKLFWAFPDDDPKKWSKSGQKMIPARSGVKKIDKEMTKK